MGVILEVKNLFVSFKNHKILRGINFTLQEGKSLALIGGSGEGKSTLLRSIIGLENPSSGKILFENQNILRMTTEECVSIRKMVSYVFQGGALFDSMTVYENLAFPLREHTKFSENKIKNIVSESLKEFSLESCGSLYPIELSGGMHKRVGIARATIIKPKVILYDEPTTGLDPYKKRNMQNTIIKLQKKGASSIIVTHDMQTALRTCDTIALLEKGKIQAINTTKNFNNNNDINNTVLHNFVSGIK